MGREDLAGFFIYKGAPVSMSTGCVLRMTEVKKLLAEDPRRIHERGAHDFPVLWYTAFGMERPDLLELLVASRADVHSGMMGTTRMQLAEKKKYRRLIEILHAHGA